MFRKLGKNRVDMWSFVRLYFVPCGILRTVESSICDTNDTMSPSFSPRCVCILIIGNKIQGWEIFIMKHCNIFLIMLMRHFPYFLSISLYQIVELTRMNIKYSLLTTTDYNRILFSIQFKMNQNKIIYTWIFFARVTFEWQRDASREDEIISQEEMKISCSSVVMLKHNL